MSRLYTVLEEQSLLECPISWNVFRDPVVTACGHTFSREMLISSNNQQPILCRCPRCRTPQYTTPAIPDLVLQQFIECYEQSPEVRSEAAIRSLLICPASKKLYYHPYLLNCGHSVNPSVFNAYRQKFYECVCCHKTTELTQMRINFRLHDIASELAFLFSDDEKSTNDSDQQLAQAVSSDNVDAVVSLVEHLGKPITSVSVLFYPTIFHMALSYNSFSVLIMFCEALTLELGSSRRITDVDLIRYFTKIVKAGEIRLNELLNVIRMKLEAPMQQRWLPLLYQCCYDFAACEPSSNVLNRLILAEPHFINTVFAGGKTLFYLALEALSLHTENQTRQAHWQSVIDTLLSCQNLDVTLRYGDMTALHLCLHDRLTQYLDPILKNPDARKTIQRATGQNKAAITHAYLWYKRDTLEQSRHDALGKLLVCLFIDSIKENKLPSIFFMEAENVKLNFRLIDAMLEVTLRDVFNEASQYAFYHQILLWLKHLMLNGPLFDVLMTLENYVKACVVLFDLIDNIDNIDNINHIANRPIITLLKLATQNLGLVYLERYCEQSTHSLEEKLDWITRFREHSLVAHRPPSCNGWRLFCCWGRSERTDFLNQLECLETIVRMRSEHLYFTSSV